MTHSAGATGVDKIEERVRSLEEHRAFLKGGAAVGQWSMGIALTALLGAATTFFTMHGDLAVLRERSVQIQGDMERIREALRAIPGGPWLTSYKASTAYLEQRGTIQRIDGESLWIALEGTGELQMLEIDADTRITVDGVKSKAAALRNGMKICAFGRKNEAAVLIDAWTTPGAA
jgi:hypothetical protein